MSHYQDTYRHKGLRARLVEELMQKGIVNQAVLDAIGLIPRHLFIDSSFIKFAYQDKAFPIGAGQTISMPYTVALQTELLDLQKTDRVLEIGTGSGYQAAVLASMGLKLFTIERQKELYEKTQLLLTSLGYRMMFFLGDGYKGLPTYGPFNKIIVTAGAPFVPSSLLSQLTIGGIMVIPLGDKTQIMTRIKRLSDDEFEKQEFGQCAFVPMLAGVEI